MIQHLTLKPDFEQTVARFAAWWHGQIVDRPPVTLSVVPSRPYGGPTGNHPTWRERWFDTEFVVEAAIARMEQRDYPADSYPIFYANLGPEITATLFGCELTFTETTSWSTPIIHQADDWQRIPETPPHFDNPYWQAIEQITAYAIERNEGRYVVGMTDLHGNYDILAALRDPMQLCLDVIDQRELVLAAGRHVAQGFVASFERHYQQIAAAGFGSTTWLPAIHDGPAYVPSCDFWCMLSPEMAREMVWPDLLVEMAPLERSIFHLDGPQALPHLDLLLNHQPLNAVQWVYGAGSGPAARWLDVYRRIRPAGKSIQLLAEDPRDAMTVLEALGPEGIWVTVDQPFASLEEAERFVKDVAAVTGPTA